MLDRMKIEKNNLYSRYKQDADACKNGYYGYELWLENKLMEAESELKKLRVTDVSGRSEQLCPECGSNDIEAIVCGDLGCNNCGNIWA